MPDDSKLETIPVGSLGIIAHKSIVPLGEKVDSYIVKWRKNRQNENKSSIVFHGYEKDSYLIKADCPRFGSGEAKGIVSNLLSSGIIKILLICFRCLPFVPGYAFHSFYIADVISVEIEDEIAINYS